MVKALSNRTSYFLIVLIVIGFIGCQNKNTTSANDVTNPLSAEVTIETASEDLPKIEFETDFHDFGTIKQGEKVEYSFPFINSGKADLLILQASGSCGCTIPEYSKEPIKSKEKGYLKVLFDSKGKEGIVEKEVNILTNGIPNQHKLKIKVTVLTN